MRRITAITNDSCMRGLMFGKMREIILGIRDEHITAVRAFVKSPELQQETGRQIREDCQELLDYVSASRFLQIEIDSRSKDNLVSVGEKLSCRLMTAMLRDRHVEAEYVSLSGIIPPKGSDRLEPGWFKEAAAMFAERLEACQDRVPVITGFFGVVPGNLIDSGIGRGYSDLCAVLVAKGLQAERVHIWKEVDGIFTADPREVANARCLPTITPSEAAELTFYGSEVVHNLALALAIEADPAICISVRNVRKPLGKGTEIIPNPLVEKPLLTLESPDAADSGISSPISEASTASRMPTAVTTKKGIVVLNVLSNKSSMSHGFFASLFAILADHDISVDLISTSEVHVSMAISTTSTNAIRIENARKKLSEEGKVAVLYDMAILSLVGAELKSMTGVAGRMFSVLGNHGINIEMISQGMRTATALFTIFN